MDTNVKIAGIAALVACAVIVGNQWMKNMGRPGLENLAPV